MGYSILRYSLSLNIEYLFLFIASKESLKIE